MSEQTQDQDVKAAKEIVSFLRMCASVWVCILLPLATLALVVASLGAAWYCGKWYGERIGESRGYDRGKNVIRQTIPTAKPETKVPRMEPCEDHD